MTKLRKYSSQNMQASQKGGPWYIMSRRHFPKWWGMVCHKEWSLSVSLLGYQCTEMIHIPVVQKIARSIKQVTSQGDQTDGHITGEGGLLGYDKNFMF